MILNKDWHKKLPLPAIAAPMFLVSGLPLVLAACQSGMVGAFPALNARSTDELTAWLTQLNAANLPAPYAVNLIVHPSNARLEADIAAVVAAKVPIIITSLGSAREVIDAIHGYGGIVLHDVISLRHAQKAAQAGVDGLILVCAGAGGHAGTLNPFAFVPAVRRFFNGLIILAGGISDGHGVAAALRLGADLAYIGTSLIATSESMASPDYKQMICTAQAADIIYTAAVSGVAGNFMQQSLAANGVDPKKLPEHKMDLSGEAKAWKTIWSAGQSVENITQIEDAATLIARWRAEFSAR